jgi:hypothetical protein
MMFVAFLSDCHQVLRGAMQLHETREFYLQDNLPILGPNPLHVQNPLLSEHDSDTDDEAKELKRGNSEHQKNYRRNLISRYLVEILDGDVYILRDVPMDLRSDRWFMRRCVKADGRALYWASQELKADKSVVLLAVQCYGRALEHASSTLQHDKDVVIEAVTQDGFAVVFAPPELRECRDVLLAAVKQNGYAMQHAPPHLQADRDFMLKAVSNNGVTLRYASSDLQADDDIVFAAVQNDSRALEDASREHQAMKRLVLRAVRKKGYALQWAPTLQADKEVVLAAVANDGLALRFAGKGLRSDVDVCLVAMGQTSEAAAYLSGPWHNEPLHLEAEARRRLRDGSGFVLGALAFATPPPPSERSEGQALLSRAPEATLARFLGGGKVGGETGVALKRNISSMLGAPLGKEVLPLMRASTALRALHEKQRQAKKFRWICAAIGITSLAVAMSVASSVLWVRASALISNWAVLAEDILPMPYVATLGHLLVAITELVVDLRVLVMELLLFWSLFVGFLFALGAIICIVIYVDYIFN